VELSEVIASRRSIRKFKQQDISSDTVSLLLDAARLAPSGSNLQPARFIVAQTKAAKDALSQCTPYKFITKASVVFICCADLTALSSREKRIGELLEAGAFEGVEMASDSGSAYTSALMEADAARAYLSMNVAIAVEHIVLKAVDLGLGSCWLGRFDRDKLKEYLKLEDSVYPVVLLPVGYPDQSPKQRPRFDLDKLIIKTI
jgi:nitroreductase